MMTTHSHRCADELFSFAQLFQKFNRPVLFDENEEEEQISDFESSSESDCEDHHDDASDSEHENDDDEDGKEGDGATREPKEKDKPSFYS